MNKSFKKSFSVGFSTVELLVSVALFSLVVLISIASMLVLMDANQKARSVKTAVDNLNFVVDDISRNLRLGSKFYCLTSVPTAPITIGGNTQDCLYNPSQSFSGGGVYVALRDRSGKALIYRFNGTRIQEKLTGSAWSGYTDSDPTNGFLDMTSASVTITYMRFFVFNTAANSGAQPYVIIAIKGRAGQKASTQTSFSIMTSISQRIPHNAE